MKKTFFLSILFLCSIFLNAQNVYLDSLTNVTKQAQISPLEKMKTYGLLVEYFRTEMKYDEASSMNKLLLQLSKKEKDYTQITKGYANQGIILNNQNQYDKAALYIDSVRISSKKTNDKVAQAYAEYLMFYQAKSFRNFKTAIKHGLQSLLFLEGMDSELILEFKINYQLYGIYTEWNDLSNSKKYAQKAIEKALKSGNKNDLSNAYLAMAVVYTYDYQNSNSEADFKKILSYCEKAIALYKKYPNQISSYTYTMARNNLASYLLRYSSTLTPEIRKQIEYNINESLKLSSELANAQSTQTASLGMLSNLARSDGDLNAAEDYMLKAYGVLLTQNPIYYHIMLRVVTELSDIYEQKGNLIKALEFQKKANEYKDLLFNQQEAESVKKIEAQYQFEKKEQELQVLKERAENHRKQKFLYIGLVVIGIIGAFFMFRSYHFRLRYSLESEKKLATEKKEAELQVKFEKEEQHRLKAEQEILALQQEKLQNEVMANKLQLQHKKKVLQKLKEEFDNDKLPNLNINQIIREENLLDNDFNKIKFHIQELHPNFFKILSAKALQKLTSLDMKYCAYFYLGMDTKQIANALNVEPKSVRMTKYRLKQKFGLDAKMDLIDYLRQML